MRAGIACCGLLLGCGRLDFTPLDDGRSGPAADACDTSARPIELQELHTGELVIGSSATGMVAPLSLPLDRTILFTTVREIEPSPAYGNTMCTLAVEGISCVRLSAGTDYAQSVGEIRVRWTTVTFSRGVTVQRGIADLTNATPALETLTTIDPNSSFVVLGGGDKNTGASWGTDEYMRGQVIDAQTVEVGALASSGVASWQVVSMTGTQVQRGIVNLAMSAVQTTSPITAVDPARAFATVSTTENSSIGLGVGMSMLTAAVDTPTSVRFERGDGGVPLDAAWEVITLPFTVEHGVATLPAGVTTATASIAASTATSVALASGQSVLGISGGRSTFQTSDGNLVDLVGEGAATLALSPGMLTIERASSLGASTFEWTVIDFGSCP